MKISEKLNGSYGSELDRQMIVKTTKKKKMSYVYIKIDEQMD